MRTFQNPVFYMLLMIFITNGYSQNQSEIPLWPNGAPGVKSSGGEEKVRIYEATGDHIVSNIHRPSITPYTPVAGKSTGIAIVIAPGGGHRELWIDHEGYTIAKRLKEKGIAAFVLKYRLADEENSPYTVDDHSVKDMLRAIRVVRSRAADWQIDPNKIGVMGFSAGGEIAGLADMVADSGQANSTDPIDRISSKPNFQALIYPWHSNRFVPTRQSSPAFIVCGFKDDLDNMSQKMPGLYLKFKKLNIPSELHIYANAGHGFGVRQGDAGASSKWLDALIVWLFDVNSDRK